MKLRPSLTYLTIFLCSFIMACQDTTKITQTQSNNTNSKADEKRDLHSYANPDQIRVRHVDLDLEVLFDRKILKGTSTLTLLRPSSGPHPLKLDTRDLKIIKAESLN